MTLFFILLIALVVYLFATRNMIRPVPCGYYGMALLFSVFLIFGSTSANAESNPQGISDKTYCTNLIQQLFTSDLTTIEENGGISHYETRRFVKYSACMIFPLVDLGEDYRIGDGQIKIAKIEQVEGHANLYRVQYYGDNWGYIQNTTLVLMNKEDGAWKIDNAYHKSDTDGKFHLMIDYTKSPDYYYNCPMCGDC